MKYIITQHKYLTNSRHVELHDKLTKLESTYYAKTVATVVFESCLDKMKTGETVSLTVINDENN